MSNLSHYEMTKPRILKGYRQKLMTVRARVKYQQRVLKEFRRHLKHGTFPKRMKSIKPYPKMDTPEAQKVVDAACDQVQCVILDQKILELEKKLKEDQVTCQSLMEQRCQDRQHLIPKKPPKLTIAKLKAELADLQQKYAELSTKVETSPKGA